MMKRATSALWLSSLLLLLALAPAAGAARGGKSTGTGIQEIEREMRLAFQRSHPCPSTGKASGYCPGYVIGYVVLPKHGGKYDESNMRWMTEEEAKRTGQDMRW